MAVYHLAEEEGPVIDAGPFKNDGEAVGVVRGVEGRYGKCYEFGGKGSYVEVPDSESLSLEGDFTIECYFNPDKLNKATIIGKWDRPGRGREGEKSFALMLQDAHIRGVLSSDGRTETVALISSATIQKGGWNHIALVRNGEEVALWINGEKDASTGYYSGPIYNGEGPLRIGSADAGPQREFRGKIDEVRILNIAKTSYGDLLRQEFDNNGNLTDDGIFHYFWDAFNRLVKVTLSSDHTKEIAAYSYDTMNRRIKKVVSNSGDLNGTTKFIYSGWQVIEERDENDNVLRSYTYGSYLDEPIAMTDSTDTYYYHTNTQYSVAAITNSSGNVVEQYRYTAYGKPTILDGQGQTIATSAIGNTYMFTGRRYDPETGLYNFRMRYYSPKLGRFVGRDPIGYVDGMNLYRGYFVPGGVDPFGIFVIYVAHETESPVVSAQTLLQAFPCCNNFYIKFDVELWEDDWGTGPGYGDDFMQQGSGLNISVSRSGVETVGQGVTWGGQGGFWASETFVFAPTDYSGGLEGEYIEVYTIWKWSAQCTDPENEATIEGSSTSGSKSYIGGYVSGGTMG